MRDEEATNGLGEIRGQGHEQMRNSPAIDAGKRQKIMRDGW
jgi:hypothetical protein